VEGTCIRLLARVRIAKTSKTVVTDLLQFYVEAFAGVLAKSTPFRLTKFRVLSTKQRHPTNLKAAKKGLPGNFLINTNQPLLQVNLTTCPSKQNKWIGESKKVYYVWYKSKAFYGLTNASICFHFLPYFVKMATISFVTIESRDHKKSGKCKDQRKPPIGYDFEVIHRWW